MGYDMATQTATSSSNPLLQQLAKSIQAIETQTTAIKKVSSCGCSQLDAMLPMHGFAHGSIIEWISSTSGDGALTLAMKAAKAAMDNGQHLIVIDQAKSFYPPAAAALGIALERMIVLHPSNQADAMWCLDQALRSPATAAVIAWQDNISDTNARRLQLAAEQGNSLGFLLRDSRRMKSQATWSDMSWRVMPCVPSSSNLVPGSSNLVPGSAWNASERGSASHHNNDHHHASWQDVRWLQLQLVRMRAGRGNSSMASQIAAGKANFLVSIHGHDGSMYAQRAIDRSLITRVRNEVANESSSALHLAAELAMPARRSPAASLRRTGS
jgi:hypothetical protein